MPQNDVVISTVNLRDADEATYCELGALVELLRAERWPEEPPVALSERIASWQTMPAVMDVTNWLARDGANGRLVGHAYLNGMQTEEERHAAEFNVGVHPGARRRSTGRRVAAALAGAALRKGGRPLRRLFRSGAVALATADRRTGQHGRAAGVPRPPSALICPTPAPL